MKPVSSFGLFSRKIFRARKVSQRHDESSNGNPRTCRNHRGAVRCGARRLERGRRALLLPAGRGAQTGGARVRGRRLRRHSGGCRRGHRGRAPGQEDPSAFLRRTCGRNDLRRPHRHRSRHEGIHRRAGVGFLRQDREEKRLQPVAGGGPLPQDAGGGGCRGAFRATAGVGRHGGQTASSPSPWTRA